MEPNMKPQKIDYRNMVALFSKALTMDMTHPPIRRMGENDVSCGKWIVFGYFDFLEVYPLPQKEVSWLSDILKHNQVLSAELDGDYYFHPLHLTTGSSRTEDSGKYEDFWTKNDDKPFLFLTLVQETTQGSISKIREKVLKSKTPVERVCYRTMELSDLVVVWRSASLSDIFQEIHELYQMEEVGDMSTFSSVSQALVNGPKENWAAVDPDKEFFASARYVVRSVQESHEYLLWLKEQNIDISHVYFSTGMEDLHMLQENMSVKTLLSLLHTHLNDGHHRAFFECSTRLGIPETILSGKEPPSAEPEEPGSQNDGSQGKNGMESVFSTRCKELLVKFQDVRNNTKNAKDFEGSEDFSGIYEISWMKPSSNLLNALTDMSKNWVMDGFCYLIYDAARLFCSKIEHWAASRRPMKKKETEAVQRFIRGWGGLMEQVTRIDGRFIQMPGFSPALCEIPAHLLEFYLSVMMCCADLMGKKAEGHDVALLLVPKICRRMKVYEILEKPQDRTHLLYVDIPMEMLYRPVSVMCGLCHELAHNVGETWRNRKRRGYFVLYAAAYELAGHLKIRSRATVYQIYTQLLDICRRPKYASQMEYAKGLSVLLQMGVNSLLPDDAVFSSWHVAYQEEKNLLSYQMRNVRLESDVCRNKILADATELFSDLENLIYLFRECYADMVMICLLNPNEEMYRSFAEQEITSWIEENGGFYPDRQYYLLVERWGIVIRAARKAEIWKREAPGKEPGPALKRFCEDIDRFIDWFNASGEDFPEHRSKESLQQVLDYLVVCYGIIDKTLGSKTAAPKDSEQLERLRGLFTKLSCQYDIDYDACGHFIELYRKTILN